MTSSREITADEARVRHTDVLLRARFPYLITRIFAVQPHDFLIVIDPGSEDASSIAEEFNSSIRPATMKVELSNTMPTTYFHEISPVDDRKVAGDLAGLPYRHFDIVNLLRTRFPDLPIVNAKVTKECVEISLAALCPDDMRETVIAFGGSLGVGLPFTIKVTPETPPTVLTPPGNDVLFVIASNMRPYAPKFVRRDEAFWFENLAAIAEGDIKREGFPGMKGNETRCYVDVSFGEHINLRQLLMLYDKVFLSLPLAENHAAFLVHQGLTDEDLLAVASSGRLQFVMTQPEERLNLRLLYAIEERAPQAVLGRRTTAALLLSSVVNAASDYKLASPGHSYVLKAVSEGLAPIWSLSASDLLRLLLWPLQARRQALNGLMDRGSKGSPAIGLSQILAGIIKCRHGKDLALETMFLSERVHIGHALNATVFPSLNEPEGWRALMAAMGEELNFFQSFNTRIAASWIGNQKRRAAREVVLPPISMFEFDSAIPIAEFLNDTSWSSTRQAGHGLFTRLSNLPADLRSEEIEKLKTRFRDKGRWHPRQLISFDTVDTGLGLASLFGFFVYPPLSGLAKLASPVLERLRQDARIDAFLADITADMQSLIGDNQDLEFIAQIDRVASFTSNYV